MNATEDKGDVSRRLYERPQEGQERIDLVENIIDGRIKIAFVFPVWGRPEILRIVLENFAQVRHSLRDLYQMVAFCVVSPDDDPQIMEVDEVLLPLAHSSAIQIVEESNEFQGKKWNAAFRAANIWGANMVVQMGSDNLISWPYVERAAANVSAGRDLVGIRQCVFFDWDTGATGVVFPKKNPFGYGPGRFYSSRLLERLDWAPYPSKAKRRMEAQIGQNLKSVGADSSFLYDMVFGPGAAEVNQIIVDLKSSESMNAFDAARKRRIREGEWTDNPKGLAVRMFPDLSWPTRFLPFLTRWIETQDDTNERRN